ncbi:MAG: sulfurtransferase [Nitrosopumilus sp. H8]|nr:MAG: sulfurtransferase [Nitrosopumilus sp. H13]RNJ78735.1 MAG: sulfurtransferase [Nitrosopumilus sp. H8]
MSGAVTASTDSVRSGVRDKSLRVVDVRRADDYKKDHIPTAVNLPLADLLSDDDPGRVAKLAGAMGIDNETSVVVYDDTFGALASRVAWTLEYIGHADVSLLEGTYADWKSLGLESDSDTPDVQKKDHAASVRPEILATAEYLESAKERDDVILVDNRERLNYLEQHIPGAISIPYRTLGGNGRILRSQEEMRRLLENRGVSDTSEIITYCGSVGTLSGLAYYALKSAGHKNARLYVRSFKEWKSLQKPTAKQEDASYWDLSAE